MSVAPLSACGSQRLGPRRSAVRRFARLLWAVLLVLLGAVAAGPARAADSAPQIRQIPHDLPVQDDLVARSSQLASERRWADVVAICETAARKGTLAPEVQHRYDLAKIHCDLGRRHCERAFREQLAKLAETDARRLYAEVLARIASHHV